jgi:hypothetical protein
VGRDAASKACFLKNSNRNICKKALDSTRRIEAARHSSGSLAPELLSSTPTGARKSGDRSRQASEQKAGVMKVHWQPNESEEDDREYSAQHQRRDTPEPERQGPVDHSSIKAVNGDYNG